jgi:hypothetical protein
MVNLFQNILISAKRRSMNITIGEDNSLLSVEPKVKGSCGVLFARIGYMVTRLFTILWEKMMKPCSMRNTGILDIVIAMYNNFIV